MAARLDYEINQSNGTKIFGAMSPHANIGSIEREWQMANKIKGKIVYYIRRTGSFSLFPTIGPLHDPYGRTEDLQMTCERKKATGEQMGEFYWHGQWRAARAFKLEDVVTQLWQRETNYLGGQVRKLICSTIWKEGYCWINGSTIYKIILDFAIQLSD